MWDSLRVGAQKSSYILEKHLKECVILIFDSEEHCIYF